MSHSPPHEESNEVSWPGSISGYVLGLILSLACTLVTFILVMTGVISGNTLFPVIIAIGLVQLVVQLVYFLHLGRGHDRQWNLLVAALALMVIVIVGGGTLWIMFSLSGRVMPGMTL